MFDELFSEIHEQCSKEIWSKGIQLARRDAVTGDEENTEELKLRVLERERGISAQVSLFLDELDWQSDCHCKNDPCYHIVAAVVAVKRSREQGQALPRSKTAAGRVGYRFERRDGSLFFKRVIISDEGPEENLSGPLSPTDQRRGELQVSATREDMAVEVALGYERFGVLNSDRMLKLLPSLTEMVDIKLDAEPIRISKEPMGLICEIRDEGSGIVAKVRLDPAIEETFLNGAVRSQHALHPSPPLKIEGSLLRVLKEGKFFAFQELADFASRILPMLQSQMRILDQSRNLPKLADDHLIELELNLSTHGHMLKVTPAIVYGSPPLARVDAEGFRLLDRKAPSRDIYTENKLKDRLRQETGLDFDHPSFYQASQAIRMVQSLQSWSGHLTGDGLKSFRLYDELLVNFQIPHDPSRIDFTLEFSTSDQEDASGPVKKADAKAVFEAWTQGESLVPLLGGGWAPLPQDWFQRYGPIIKSLWAAKEEQGELGKVHLPSLIQLATDLGLEISEQLNQFKAQIENFQGIKTADLPTPFQASLRDYQKLGVNWLSFLKSNQLGGLLADDMGLGKTLQAITILESKSLIIAPTSVLPNWKKELERFRPNLKINIYHGPQRKFNSADDVVLTSYTLLRMDLEQLIKVHWRVIVLDEAQAIKNPDSQVSKAAYQLRGDFRLALSGTPVENHLEDLWSQFQFLNPGLLSSRQFFRDDYVKPILDGDPLATVRLQQKIKPFLLRRLKKEVAPELPPRIEKVLFAELSSQERDLYQSIQAATQKEVVQKLKDGGNVLEALEALLRMRQACCHPSLLPDQSGADSAKLNVLKDSLNVVLQEGHKVLVFSQWTSFLDLIGQMLLDEQITYLRLDGSTANRGAIVEQFQDEKGPPVLIMSLKAGGVGLNLSRADHVYIMDPWWNPAVEDQAADRAHRIGQENPVIIHPIVAIDTVEEKILELQQKKRALAEAAIGEGQAALQLSRQDLLQLFQ